jgi:hypothetical protein
MDSLYEMLDEMMVCYSYEDQENTDILEEQLREKLAAAMQDDEIGLLQTIALVRLGQSFLHSSEVASDVIAGALIVNHNIDDLCTLRVVCSRIKAAWMDRLGDHEEPLRGFISFEDSGEVVISPVAHRPSLQRMGVPTDQRINVGNFTEGQRRYLDFHRNAVLLRAIR